MSANTVSVWHALRDGDRLQDLCMGSLVRSRHHFGRCAGPTAIVVAPSLRISRDSLEVELVIGDDDFKVRRPAPST